MKQRIEWLLYALLGRDIADKLTVSLLVSKRDKELSQIIASNRRFFNTHCGERCFILGNGPSLKQVDLNLLKNEFVFTVNNFSLVDGFEKARPNVHLWADYSFYEMREDQKYNHDELMDNYRKMALLSPICFMVDVAYGFVKKNNLDKILDINYFSVTGSIDTKKRNQFDLSKAISAYTTVVQYAVSIAIYMGFKEIYLLGCDTTNIISLINSAMDIRSENMHAYKNDDVNERYKELLNHWSMSDAFYDQYVLFEGFKTLKSECDKRGISLVNCSAKTLINELPRDTLSNVLRNSNA